VFEARCKAEKTAPSTYSEAGAATEGEKAAERTDSTPEHPAGAWRVRNHQNA